MIYSAYKHKIEVYEESLCYNKGEPSQRFESALPTRSTTSLLQGTTSLQQGLFNYKDPN